MVGFHLKGEEGGGSREEGGEGGRREEEEGEGRERGWGIKCVCASV